MPVPKVSLRSICRMVGVSHIQVTEVLRRISDSVLAGNEVITQEVGTFRPVDRKARPRVLNGVTHSVDANRVVGLRPNKSVAVPEPVEFERAAFSLGQTDSTQSSALTGLSSHTGKARIFVGQFLEPLNPTGVVKVEILVQDISVHGWGSIGGVEVLSEADYVMGSSSLPQTVAVDSFEVSFNVGGLGELLVPFQFTNDQGFVSGMSTTGVEWRVTTVDV